VKAFLTMRLPRRIPARRLALLAAAGLSLAALAPAAFRARFVSPEPTLLLRDRNDVFLGEVAFSTAQDQFGYWALAEVPSRVAAATIAVEDCRFTSHPGVDPFAAFRALAANLRRMRRVSGGSTLAMQVARLQHPGRRSLLRKAQESLTALLLTARYGRAGILRHYLEIVPYGNRVHGIAYAARRYLDKPVEDLSWAETAFLTAIPKSPRKMNPFDPEGRLRAIQRGKKILRLLHDRGALSDDELSLATREIGRLRVPPRGERPPEAIHAVLRFAEEARTAETHRALTSRTVVRMTLDLPLQRRVAVAARDAVAVWEKQGAGNAAVIVVDRKRNTVVARVGSTKWTDAEHAGAIDYARLPRSPGSALKPFLYALALERGTITPATILPDLDRGAGGITNADDLFLGPLLPRVALANSRNVPAADLLDRVGLAEGYDFLRALALHDGSIPVHRYGLGLAIGGMPVTLDELVRAYTVFTNDGVLVEPLAWEGQPLPRPRRLVSEETARAVTLYLADPMARLPSFPRMGVTEYPFPVAVKTGTSSRYRDAWTVAFSARYLVGVWIGHPDFKPMNKLSGYRAAAELAQRVMGALHADQADGLADLSFPAPRGYSSVRLCAMTGRLATEACEKTVTEWIRPGQEPLDPCASHVRLAVDARSGLLATRATPRRFVRLRTFVDLGPRYAAWSAAAGLPHPPSGTAWGELRSPHEPPSANRPVESAGDSPLADMTSRMKITSPENGLRVVRDPETPVADATVALEAVVSPAAREIVWWIDGAPFATVAWPYTARWQVTPGAHTFVARLPFVKLASPPVSIRVE
jgi:penicillin-binding protein 1C